MQAQLLSRFRPKLHEGHSIAGICLIRLEAVRPRFVTPEPLQVEEVHSSYFADEARFPRGSVAFDCALVMRNLRHEWHSAEDLFHEGGRSTMGKTTLAVLVTVAFSVVGVVGDYFLKLASTREHPLGTGSFYVGFALYASTAFGWVFVMRHLKLATISVLYSVSMILLLTAVGVVMFRESLSYFELAGIVLAVAALVLLMRFA